MSPQKSVLGLDIGSSFVKLVQLRKEQERGDFGNLRRNLPRALRQNEYRPKCQIAAGRDCPGHKRFDERIQQQNRYGKGFHPAQVKFCENNIVAFRPRKNISAEVIAMEARRHIPVPVSEVALDWWIIPENENDMKKTEKKDRNSSCRYS